jgi:hypothetical protein
MKKASCLTGSSEIAGALNAHGTTTIDLSAIDDDGNIRVSLAAYNFSLARRMILGR